LIAEEGLAVGHSSAVNVAGAIQLAKRLGPGHRIATVLCDGLGRYESKLGDVARLQSLGLPPPPWLVSGEAA
jgi:cysteine synthase A